MDGDASSASYIQAERILRIETPLGADVLLPEHVEMREAVNDLFTLHVAVRSKKTDIKPNEIVGKLVDVSLELGQGERRTWNGLVVRLVEGPPVTRGMRSYQLEIRPQHWLMSQRSDCRIWQDKTSLELGLESRVMIAMRRFGMNRTQAVAHLKQAALDEAELAKAGVDPPMLSAGGAARDGDGDGRVGEAESDAQPEPDDDEPDDY